MIVLIFLSVFEFNIFIMCLVARKSGFAACEQRCFVASEQQRCRQVCIRSSLIRAFGIPFKLATCKILIFKLVSVAVQAVFTKLKDRFYRDKVQICAGCIVKHLLECEKMRIHCIYITTY